LNARRRQQEREPAWSGRCQERDRLDNIDMAPADPHGDAPDDLLVQRARAGDRESYGELVRRHQSAALRLAAAVCGSTEEARDIVQDAFVKGFRSLGAYRGEAPVRAWLLRIVANDAKNTVRGRRRRRAREDRYELLHARRHAGDPVGERVSFDDEVHGLLGLLGGLDERDREVLACRFVAGLSEPETAAALGVPVGTVKSRTARALARARAMVGSEEAGRD
jgi:RNA polymerase sigma-70 factor (ECF subfamily)